MIGLITWVSFLSAERLVRLLGVNGAGALNRILGLFILAIAVNLMVSGVKTLCPCSRKKCPSPRVSDGSFMIQPRFETGDPRYRWLNRLAAVGEGRLEPGIVEYRILQLVNG